LPLDGSAQPLRSAQWSGSHRPDAAGDWLGLGATIAFELGPDTRAELHFIVMLARVQRVEVGDAIDAKQDRFTIEPKFVWRILRTAPDEASATDPIKAAGPSTGSR
jgi:hypothetical protein